VLLKKDNVVEPTLAKALPPEMVKRLQQALMGGSEELFQVMLDPAPEVLRAGLKNRALQSEHLLVLLKRRDLPEDLLQFVGHLDIVAGNHRLQRALATNPSTPNQMVLALLPHLFLFELLDICLLAGPSPDQKLAAERVIIQRLPTTEPGQKLTLARRGTTTLLAELMKHGEPQLVATCLNNLRLRESAIVQFLQGNSASAETISMVARHPRWQTRPHIRHAILRNQKTPGIWFTLFLPHLALPEVKALLLSNRLSPAQQVSVKEEMLRRRWQSRSRDNRTRRNI